MLVYKKEQESGGLSSSKVYNHDMNTNTQLSDDYARIEQVIYYLEKNAYRQPNLIEIAESIHLSEYHFQRLFTRWVGISPKRFLQFITKEHAKQLLARSESILEATYQVGLSSPGRLHDLFITWEAVTPGEYKMRGSGLTIHYGFHHSPFGEILIGSTDRGICNLAFVSPYGHSESLENLHKNWPQARLVDDPSITQPLVAPIFQRTGKTPYVPLSLYLSGSNFQLKVWEALLRIPSGNVVSYREVAAIIGDPKASRAVGNALANNPVAVLIPCHRVINSLGEFGHYHYGDARKIALLGWEMAKVTYAGS